MAIAWLMRTVTHKYLFTVDNKLYCQTQGLVIGSPWSGTVPNLALARREKKFNVSREGILEYTRYIDDIFMLLEARNKYDI